MIKVTFNCAEHHVETLEQALNELGAASLVISPADDEEIFEYDIDTKQLWKNCLISAFFDDSVQEDFLQTESEQLSSDLNVPFEISEEQNQDWSTTWQKDFTIMHFGERLVIYPSHETPEKIEEHAILLDPGLAFGTGKHPTTSLCLQWLDTNIKGGESVIDYGCGSGILAIAARKLGANPVIAVDIDPQAVEATRDNCEKNSINDIEIYLTQACPDTQADILIANILANPLIAMAEQLANHVAHKGKIALSGILLTQVDAIVDAYAPYFDIADIVNQEDWVIISGVRK